MSALVPLLDAQQNNKDYFDQSLDEIKLLKYVNSMDPNDEYAVVRLYDFFYYKVGKGLLNGPKRMPSSHDCNGFSQSQ